MSKLLLVNNEFKERKDFGVDVEDRGYQFGDGIYEVIRVYENKIFKMEDHIKRLWRSARELQLELPFSKAELTGNLFQLVEKEKPGTGIIYLQVTRGVAPRVHHFPAGAQSLAVAYTSKLERPVDIIQKGGKAVTVEDIRWLRCDIKSLNLLGNVLAKQTAVENNAAEAIMHRSEIVTEGSSSNFMIVKEGKVITHPADNFILNGITRMTIKELAAKLNIPFAERTFTLKEMFNADEAFVTSTVYEVLPITEIDGKTIGSGRPGPVTSRLLKAFEELLSLSLSSS